ncbi:hydrogenase formation protein HypD [Enterovibrio sp. ZSDZ35]|uniref:Hydrogenase maturation factor n=1 Tax=Enterovibrio qingdaonensis TaxID=2899818 RepID=A0ABT5QI97_9GAMM|nr:hydrogenase formation protein HypD [Enterovibrio sp. ZSDZ35]MDD1780703.1 hydrogenase formation protein HypD [Enterovibrio sp. ZSDZ35]
MKYVDEFRNPDVVKAVLDAINHKLDVIEKKREDDTNTPMRPLQLMEFCGGHTHTLFKYGIENLLPDRIEMVHGPGCPVCVLPMGRVDDCIEIASKPNVILTTFGDAMRVPGKHGSLLDAKAGGCDIRMVYSPLDALELARRHPDKEIVFFALGFETTMPSTALTVLQAEKEQRNNFSLFCNHITTAPTIEAILNEPDLKLDGFLAPGHVSMVIGLGPFQFIAKDYHKPIVITGFEPLDILQSILMLVTQIADERSEVENQYRRVVEKEGNDPGLTAIQRVYQTYPVTELRGFGEIGDAGVRLRPEYAAWDAEAKFSISRHATQEPDTCQCGEVLKGLIKPWQCARYGKDCTPQDPLGALMVSSEGACAAYYNHGYRSPEKGRGRIAVIDTSSQSV